MARDRPFGSDVDSQRCTNACSVREDVVRTSLLDELRYRLTSAKGLAHARKRIAERLGEVTREQGGEFRERRASLEKIEANIAKLIDFVTQGLGTKAVSDRLKALEREANEGRKALDALEKIVATPIKLPTPNEMLQIRLSSTLSSASPPTCSGGMRSSVASSGMSD